jgi:hypothetical protein
MTMPDAKDLSLEEWQAVIAALHEKIETDKYPFSDRIRILRHALAKRDLKSAPKPQPAPPPLPSGPMVSSRRKVRR